MCARSALSAGPRTLLSWAGPAISTPPTWWRQRLSAVSKPNPLKRRENTCLISLDKSSAILIPFFSWQLLETRFCSCGVVNYNYFKTSNLLFYSSDLLHILLADLKVTILQIWNIIWWYLIRLDPDPVENCRSNSCRFHSNGPFSTLS